MKVNTKEKERVSKTRQPAAREFLIKSSQILYAFDSNLTWRAGYKFPIIDVHAVAKAIVFIEAFIKWRIAGCKGYLFGEIVDYVINSNCTGTFKLSWWWWRTSSWS